MPNLLRMAYRFARYPNRAVRLRRYLAVRRNAGNALLLDREMREHQSIVKSHPIYIYLEPATVCNLECPFCPTGNGTTKLAPGLLQPDDFQKIVGHLRLEYLRCVMLFNWGEPFLNKHLTSYIRFFAARNIATFVTSNFSAKDYDDAFLDDVVASGLSQLYVSADGATQATYEKYRVKGNLDRIIGNMKRLNEAKLRAGSPTPTVQYKVLLNKFNELEIDQAREIAKSVGAELLVHENFWAPAELRDEWIADSVRQKYGGMPVTSVSMAPIDGIHTECRQLWDSALINCNGDVFPCCLIFNPAHRVGNLIENDIDEIWNNSKMQTLRRFVTDESAPAPGFDNFCAECTNRYCTHRETVPTTEQISQREQVPAFSS